MGPRATRGLMVLRGIVVLSTLTLAPAPEVSGPTSLAQSLEMEGRAALIPHALSTHGPGMVSSSLTVLQHMAVKSTTEHDYRVRLQDLLTWCRHRGMDWTTADQLDQILVGFSEEMFFKGLPLAEGTKTWQASAISKREP